MFSNYFKVAFRQLMQNKLYSTINILGLSIGLTISMFILLFVMHEMAYDNFHVNGSRIFKVMTEVKMGDQTINIEGLTSKLAPMIVLVSCNETTPTLSTFSIATLTTDHVVSFSVSA